MIKEAYGTGNSIDEAKAAALKELNCGDADYKIEVIEDVKPKILGLFGGHPAKVRVYFEAPEKKPAKKNGAKNAKKPAKAEKPAAKAQKSEKTAAAAPKAEKSEAPAKAEKPVLNYVDSSTLPEGSNVLACVKYISAVLEKMGVTNLSIKVAEIENGSQLLIDGENLGVVIGRRGETLDALQYLASFCANSNRDIGYHRIVLDIGNYREKREDTLKSLARRMASQVQRTGKVRSLEPMNPYERRIIHTQVQEIDGVVSSSVGEGANRHVVICPEGQSPRRYDNRRGGYRRNSRGGNRGDRRPSGNSTATTTPSREPRSDSEGDAPLYGRIG